MPNQYFDVQIISRGSGRSSVASASYRSGTKLTAQKDGNSVVAAASYRSGETLFDALRQRTFDYTRKEDVVYTEILIPQDAPTWVTALDRQSLWNTVEATEKRKDAQLARDIIAALPRELDREQRIALARRFIETNFTSKGMIADLAVHEKEASDGGDNPHCHIMLTMRVLTKDGFGGKNREWNEHRLVPAWRESWEKLTNDALESAGRSERVSLKSYEAQGIDKTPGVHLGEQAWNMEQRGIATEKGRKNRRVKHDNALNRPRKRKEKRQEIDAPEAKAPQNLRDVAKDQQAPPEENNRSKPKDEQGTVDPPSAAWLRHKKVLKSYRYKSRLGVEVTLAGVRARVEKVREETEHENTILTPFGHTGDPSRGMKDKDKEHER